MREMLLFSMIVLIFWILWPRTTLSWKVGPIENFFLSIIVLLLVCLFRIFWIFYALIKCLGFSSTSGSFWICLSCSLKSMCGFGLFIGTGEWTVVLASFPSYLDLLPPCSLTFVLDFCSVVLSSLLYGLKLLFKVMCLLIWKVCFIDSTIWSCEN